MQVGVLTRSKAVPSSGQLPCSGYVAKSATYRVSRFARSTLRLADEHSSAHFNSSMGGCMSVKFGLLPVLAILIASGGCHSMKHDEINEITLEDALKQVGTGLRLMHDAAHPPQDAAHPTTEPTDKSFGLYADEVTVTFNVQGSRTDSKSLTVSADISPPAIIPVKGSISDTSSNSKTYARGNTITITFKNPVFATSGTLAHDAVTGVSGGSGKDDGASTGNKPGTGKEDGTSTGNKPGTGNTTNQTTPTSGAKPATSDTASDRVDALDKLLKNLGNTFKTTKEDK